MKESTKKKEIHCHDCKEVSRSPEEVKELFDNFERELRKKANLPSHEEWIEEEAARVMKRIEKETSYDATQWHDMLVWEAGDADTVFGIIKDSLKEAFALGRKQGLEEAREKIETEFNELSTGKSWEAEQLKSVILHEAEEVKKRLLFALNEGKEI